MLSNRFVFIIADISFVPVYSFSDTISSFTNIYNKRYVSLVLCVRLFGFVSYTVPRRI